MGYIAGLKELNIQYAIKGQCKARLKDILQLLTKDRLNEIAANRDLSGRSKMKKQELVDALFEHNRNFHGLENIMLVANDEEWSLFNELVDVPYLQNDNVSPKLYFYWMNRGLMFSFYHEDKLLFLVPEEIKEWYRKQALTSLLPVRDRCQQVNKYLNAAANLYGACKLEAVFGIMVHDHGLPLSEEQFVADCQLAASRQQGWYLDKELLISDYFQQENLDELKTLTENAENKPYYKPAPEEFLKYSDSGYFEMTPQLRSLETYVGQHLCKDKQMVAYLIDDVQLACSMEEPLGVVMNEFERRDIHFQNKEQIHSILSLVTAVHNHTRIWSNCGHTPAELGLIRDQTGGNVIYMNQQALSIKVGRNEPCLCGSGKKHKKCCGK
ncbi:Rho termination factor N-terminal domain-containing protein [Paenibacillus sp. MMS18-CY102]|uniref:Rho termination factor N-terminal domain-containing protein n=1 Tax=Paenibacillus sp. MMS18-CY102 TaxID=2682849 RepID=UPI0013658DA5|nr:Rho termination factor N-terminal domain-containing protein [Paenibacillus sp. MMS18-CY102]MWC30769.1 hypothetical protein [Paenibacillus sp. MMS18-CY102]